MAPQSSGVKTADFQDVFRRQFRSTVFFTTLLISTTCFISFFHVFLLSSKMKVKRIHALSDMAIMQDALSFWNRTSIELPRNSVTAFCLMAIPHNSVPIVIQTTFPQPATITFQNHAFKSFTQILSWRAKEGSNYPETRMTTSTAAMTKAVVLRRCVDGEMVQPDALGIIAQMTHAQVWRNRTPEIEPNPSGSIDGISVLGEDSAPPVVRASSPMLAISDGSAGSRHGSIAINVLVEPENGVYEFSRHNDSSSVVVFSGTGRSNGLPSAATIAKFGNGIKLI